MKIVFFEGEDWEGVYIDGKLALEGHRVDTKEFISYLAKKRLANLEIVRENDLSRPIEDYLPQFVEDLN
ncbi:hypothetical protein A73_202 [Escherichia phage A73]|uniref:Uncharacterized protein n=1 Tax=Escherichia phage A73 TaxID=3003819 RepID=A0AAE9VXE6_9CAUD|nr:hypothetical protein A73_202 [Escherichia phage A73]WBF78004.1 hypothetical protein W70_187 [Escherichia phage W70]